MLRGIVTTILIVILFALAFQANAADRPTLAKIIVNREAIVGELLERTDKHVRILEISTNELRTINTDNFKSIRVDISEEEAALSVGLPEYLAWNIRRLTPTTGVNTVVVLPLCNASGQQTVEGRQFAENVTTELVRNDVRVVERTLLDKIVGELALQNSRGFDTTVAQKVGKQLGAFVVLTGTIVQKRKGYVAQLRLIKVESGEILFAATHRMPDITSKPQVVKNVKPPVVMPRAKSQERRPVPQKKKQGEPKDKEDVAEEKLEVKLRWTLTGHTGSVTALAINSDGSLLASGGSDGTIRIWQMSNGECLHVLRGHSGAVKDVEFSEDDLYLASGGADRSIRFWAMPEGKLERVFEVPEAEFRCLSFFKDYKIDSTWGDGLIRNFWEDGKNGGPTFRHSASLGSAAHSPDKTLWTFVEGSSIYAREGRVIPGNNRLFRYVARDHTEPVYSLAFNSESTLMASGSADKTVRLRDNTTGVCIRTLTGHSQPVRTVTFSPDGSMLASGSDDKTVKFWETPKGNLLKTHDPEIGKISAVTFGSDSKTFVTAGEAANIKVWDVRRLDQQKSRPTAKARPEGVEDQDDAKLNVKLRCVLRGHQKIVWTLAFSPDSLTLASCGPDMSLRIWDATTGNPLQVLENKGFEGLAYSPNAPLIAAGLKSGPINLVNAASGQIQSTLEGHTWHPLSIAFSPDGGTLASGAHGGMLRIWDLKTNVVRKVLGRYGDIIPGVSFSPDGKLLAFGAGAKGEIHILDLGSGKIQQVLKGTGRRVAQISFMPDGSTLVSGGQWPPIQFWNVSSGDLIDTWDTSGNFAVSPDGSLIAHMNREEGKLLFTGVASRKTLASIDIHEEIGWPYVCFAPDGKTVATTRGDKLIRIWDVVPLESTPKQQSEVDKPVGPTPENIIRIEPVPVEGPPAEK